MYRQFNIQQFYVLPTHCIYVFCVDFRTNSHYIPVQHYDFYNRDGECLLRGTDWALTVIQFTFVSDKLNLPPPKKLCTGEVNNTADGSTHWRCFVLKLMNSHVL